MATATADDAALAAAAALREAGPAESVAVVRAVKNAVVGNPTNKRIYLRHGLLPPLLAAAARVDAHPALAEHAVAALGSLAPHVPPPALPDVARALLQCLFSAHARATHAAARALKLLVCAPGVDVAPLAPLVVEETVVARLVALLSAPDEGIADVCAVIVARTAVSPRLANDYSRFAVVPALVRLLARTSHDRCLEACINALAALAARSAHVVQALTAHHSVVPMLLPLTRVQNNSLRLASCRLLTIFHTGATLPPSLDASVAAVLVSLLFVTCGDDFISAAHTLADLVACWPDLQRVAMDAGTIAKLAEVLNTATAGSTSIDAADGSSPMATEGPDDPFSLDAELTLPAPDLKDGKPRDSPALRAGVLTAIAALMSELDQARDAVISSNLLPVITSSLFENDVRIVLAALKCIRSLSRSVKILRRDISKHDIGEVLLRLLASDDISLRRCASGTLCNLVLEFSPIRADVLERDGINILVDLLRTKDDEVRRNALWSLKNLLFNADPKTKSTVLTRLGYDNVYALCHDEQPRVRELAMTVVRNLACSESASGQTEQLDALLAATGNRLVSLLCDALRGEMQHAETGVQALYVVCNIASGTERHKALLMESDIPQLILRWTSHEDEKARIAAVWCAINLSWKDGVAARGSPAAQAPARRPAARSGRRSIASRLPARSRIDLLHRQHLPVPAVGTADRAVLDRYSLSSPAAAFANIGTGAGPLDYEDAMGSGGAETGSESDDVAITDANTSGGGDDGSGDRGGSTDSFAGAGSNRGEGQEGSDNGAGVSDAVSERLMLDGDRGSSNSGKRNEGYEWRITRLRELGFEGRLRSLVNDPHIEVQGRARAALELFDCDDVNPLDYNPTALLDYGSGGTPIPRSRASRPHQRIARESGG